ncbi:helix-turn-helix domain-containing protein [Leuconostoc inhae]|uniref:helix-turn-helix domain-containing protein n=1 Tax=Leuconostoc inhae TaxID=178001 RepID=UPI001C7D12A4|nr:helix-turn-helix transcriptional regulator [Leuconostoc inhae]
MAFDQIIKNKRQELNITQSELAEKLFVSNKTISNWETGKTMPDLDNVLYIAKVLHLSLDKLLLEDNNMVEHVKHIQEIKATKKMTWVSYVTNFMFFLMFSTQSLFGQLPVPILVMMLIGAWANIWVLFHFWSKTDSLEDKAPNMIKINNTKAIVVTTIITVIALITTILVH